MGNDNLLGWVYGGCAIFDPAVIALRPLEKDGQVVISRIVDASGNDITESFDLKFLPPNGGFEGIYPLFEVLLQYGLDYKSQTKVKIDLS